MEKTIQTLATAFIVLISVGFYQTCKAQQKFRFNNPGSPCYFEYLTYTANNGSQAYKRPFIFILCKPGMSPDSTFRTDLLKSNPAFIDYNFVYVPNRSPEAAYNLTCLPPLVSLLTREHEKRNRNVFLYVYDSSVHQTDFAAAAKKIMFLSSDFKNVIYASEMPEMNQDLISKAFVAVSEEEEMAGKEVGTYYIDETITEEEVEEISSSAQRQKTYFGPPTRSDFTLSGLIRDKMTSEALPFTNIQIRNTHLGTQSNMDGFFTLQKVPNDTAVLIVSYLGYEKVNVFLTPSTPSENFIIELSPTTAITEAVTVVAAKEDIVLQKKEDISVIKLTPKKLEQLPNLGERDVMRSFQLMPGVSASNESSSGLYVRGGTPDQNLVLFDGFTVYQVDHLYGFFSAFNSNALKDVQLYKGGFESRFGGRLSSVVELTGKDGNQKKFNMGGDLSLLSINAWVEVPIGEKFSSVITFRRSFKGPLYKTIFEKFNGSSNKDNAQSPMAGPGGRFSQQTTVTSFFYDLNGKFTYRPNDKDIFSLSIYNGTDKLDNSFDNSNIPSFGGGNGSFGFSSTDLTKYGNLGSSLRWGRKWSPKLYGNTVLSYSYYFSDRDRSQERTLVNSSGDTTSSSSGIYENNDLQDYSLKSDYQWDLFNFAQIQFGAFATVFDIKYSYVQDDTTTILDRKNRSFLGGAYLQSKFRLFKDKLILVPGLRSSYFLASHKVYFEPRASLIYNITDRLNFKAAWGKYYQFANRITREDILSGSREFWLLSDDATVPVSSSFHYIAGFTYDMPQWLFSVEGYYKKLKGLTEYSLRFNPSPLGVNYDENFLTGEGYSRGIEFLVQRKFGKFNGWASYTLGEAKSNINEYSDTYFYANQDVRHEFKLVLMYNYRRWNFSASWIYASGRPYTAPSGAYTIPLLDGTTSEYFTVTDKNALRLPDYHRMDLAANYKLLAGAKGTRKRREIGYLGFSIFNLYNRKNTWYKQFTIEDGQIIETSVKYLGITPNVTLSLKLW